MDNPFVHFNYALQAMLVSFATEVLHFFSPLPPNIWPSYSSSSSSTFLSKWPKSVIVFCISVLHSDSDALCMVTHSSVGSDFLPFIKYTPQMCVIVISVSDVRLSISLFYRWHDLSRRVAKVICKVALFFILFIECFVYQSKMYFVLLCFIIFLEIIA